MIIGLVYTSIYPPKSVSSAADRRVRDLLRGISYHGNKTHLFIPRWHNSAISNNDSSDYQIHYIGSNFDKIPLLNRISFWVKIPFIVKRIAIEAVIFYSPTIDSLISILLLRMFKILTVMEISDIVSFGHKKSIKGFLFYLGENLLPRYSHCVLPISAKIEALIKKSAPKTPAMIIPVLVDSDLFISSIEKRKKFRKKYQIIDVEIVIGYVGGMYKDYGVDILIKAYSEVHSLTDVKTRLVIGGRLDNDPKIINALELVSKYNISNSTILTGWADTELVVEILNASDILIIPHPNNELNNAGLPTKLAEYASIGKAIIITDVGDVNKYFINKINALIVEGSCTKSLAAGISELIKDSDLRNRMTIVVKETVMKYFDYRTNGKIINDFIVNMIKSNLN